MAVIELKKAQLERIAKERESLRKHPRLRWLFFELTDRCNLNCRHCGSRCTAQGQQLTPEEVARTLQSVKTEQPMVCLTGGEPLLHPQFFEIARCVNAMGFSWGMTTNATLIDEACALKLKECGMGTVSVSLDGLEASHDALRQQKGAWQRALKGLEALQKAGFAPQVTSVFHQGNFHELGALYDLLCQRGIRSWRPINVEPIGRACEAKHMLLSPAQITELLAFIRQKRFDPDCEMEVTFGCSHYLGVETERMVRDHYFLCGAGILVASVRSNGDICACLDVENLPQLVQGNIKKDDFMQVWQTRFEPFRRDRSADCAKCVRCPERVICGGDSAHTWDFEQKAPLLCYEQWR